MFYHRERSDTPPPRRGPGGGTNPGSLPETASDGTKKAGITTCFFRTRRRKNFRTFFEGFGVDYEVKYMLSKYSMSETMGFRQVRHLTIMLRYTGKLNMNFEPFPGADSAHIFPPCFSISSLQSLRPNPVPGSLFVPVVV